MPDDAVTTCRWRHGPLLHGRVGVLAGARCLRGGERARARGSGPAAHHELRVGRARQGGGDRGARRVRPPTPQTQCAGARRGCGWRHARAAGRRRGAGHVHHLRPGHRLVADAPAAGDRGSTVDRRTARSATTSTGRSPRWRVCPIGGSTSSSARRRSSWPGCTSRGVWRLRRRGDAWPAGRTVAWLLGCAMLLRDVVGAGPLHAGDVQHPHGRPYGVVDGGADPAGAGRADDPGPAGPAARGQAASAGAAGVVVGVRAHAGGPVPHQPVRGRSCCSWRRSTGCTSRACSTWRCGTTRAHLAMNAHFLLVGYAYFWPIIGVDPSPRKLPPLGKIGLLMSPRCRSTPSSA